MSLGGLIGLPMMSPATRRIREREAPAEPPAVEQKPGALGSLITSMFGTGWAPPPEGVSDYDVRPGYGLQDAEISPRKPELEQSFAPHEQATLEDVRGSLGAIVLGGMAPGMLPGITRGGPPVKAPATPRRGGSLGALAKAKPVEPELKPGETFYSQLRRVVENPKTQATQTGEQWSKFLTGPKRGVKAEEMKFTGLGDLLKARSGKRVKREEILEHLDANEIRVEEVTKGLKLLKREDMELRDLKDRMANGSIDDAGFERVRALQEKQQYAPPTKFQDYTLPGAKNYREVLLTKARMKPTASRDLLKIQADLEKMDEVRNPTESQRQQLALLLQAERKNKLEAERAGGFIGGHWDEPNVLAHLRLSDRKVGGKKTLLVEEIQSDWAQRGRKEGFATLTQNRKDEIAARRAKIEKAQESVSRGTPEREALVSEYAALGMELSGAMGNIPSAPFVGDTAKWTTLGLKRVLKMAADEGYDRVGIVRGQEQAARYDLSKQIDSLEIHRGKAGFSVTARRGTENVIDSKFAKNESALADIVGKELAAKAAKQPSGEPVEYKGLDLKVGGEGMKGYYDKIVPEALNKLGKEYGVKVQIEGGRIGGGEYRVSQESPGAWVVKTPEGMLVLRPGIGDRPFKTKTEAEVFAKKHYEKLHTPIHTLDIPESMRENIKTKGFPLISQSFADLVEQRA